MTSILGGIFVDPFAEPSPRTNTNRQTVAGSKKMGRVSPLSSDPNSGFKTYTTPRNAHRASFKSLSELLGGPQNFESAKIGKSSPRLMSNHNNINEEIGE